MADFFVGTTVIPFISLWEVYGEWHFGARLCNVWLCCTLLFCTVSFLTVSAIALDRYLYLIESKMDRKRRTVRRAFSLIVLTWLIPALVWIPGSSPADLNHRIFFSSLLDMLRCPCPQLHRRLFSDCFAGKGLLLTGTCRVRARCHHSTFLLSDDRNDCLVHQDLSCSSWSNE